jgi:Rho-binding antiterminator
MEMKPYVPILCSQHDVIEIACLHRYALDIQLTDGTSIQGIAITTRTNAKKEEHLVITQDETEQLIRLDAIHSITPVNQNAIIGKTTIHQRAN